MRSPLQTLGSLVARTPVAFTQARTAFAGAHTPAGNPEAQMAAMGTVGTLFAIVSGLAADVAEVDWHMHRLRQRSGVCDDCGERGVTQVEDHLALRLWNKPNDFYTGYEFREAFTQHIELTGEGWWVVERGAVSDLPVGLWCPRPDRMAPVPDPETFLAGYTYRQPGGHFVPLNLDEVIQIRLPNPLDPYRGLGPVQALMVDLDAVRYTADWNRRFFLNSAEPGGIIEVPSALDDTAFKRLRAQWGEHHKGIRNAHRVGILENGMKWVDRHFSQRDMQFTELRRLGKEEIREAFRYPVFMLGTVEDVNRSTADASQAFYAQHHTVPRLKRIKNALNTELLPMFGSTGQGVEFVFANPVPSDREADNEERNSRTSAYKTLIEAGVHPADAALVVGLPPMRIAPTPTAAPVVAQLTGTGWWDQGPVPDVDDAMRWEAVEHLDDDTCEPCRDNHGKLYRNRADAWKDYPGGSGYVKCEGRDNCRGRVVRRGKKGEGNE